MRRSPSCPFFHPRPSCRSVVEELITMLAKQVIFEGRVQGVGFRYSVKDLSRGFEVCGWVKNLPDGTVEMQVMGQAEEVESFIKEIAEESPVAHHIKKLQAVKIPLLENCSGFRIERD